MKVRTAFKPETLLQLIESISVDGKLSGEEVWDLANWLNEHPSDRRVWPGCELFPLLSKVYEDSELSAEELHTVSKRVVAIEQECFERAVQKASEKSKIQALAPKETAAKEEIERKDKALRLEVEGLWLPSVGCARRTVEGYQVSLANQSCDCPDWWPQRSKIDVGHLGRCCRHVMETFYQKLFLSEEKLDVPDHVAAICADHSTRGKGTHLDEEWRLIHNFRKQPIAVSFGPREWMSVYTTGSQGFNRYGYNRIEKRWSYGKAPASSRRLVECFHTFIP